MDDLIPLILSLGIAVPLIIVKTCGTPEQPLRQLGNQHTVFVMFRLFFCGFWQRGYGFLIYNASLVFWTVARPMCRNGWQRHIINEATAILDALRAVRAAGASGGGGGKPAGKGAAGGASIPVSIDIPWLVELTLNLAFGLEDAGRDADAQKKTDEAGQLLLGVSMIYVFPTAILPPCHTYSSFDYFLGVQVLRSS